jgi:hypothetical protein
MKYGQGFCSNEDRILKVFSSNVKHAACIDSFLDLPSILGLLSQLFIKVNIFVFITCAFFIVQLGYYNLLGRSLKIFTSIAYSSYKPNVRLQ